MTCRNLENVRFHIYHYLVEVGQPVLRLTLVKSLLKCTDTIDLSKQNNVIINV